MTRENWNIKSILLNPKAVKRKNPQKCKIIFYDSKSEGLENIYYLFLSSNIKSRKFIISNCYQIINNKKRGYWDRSKSNGLGGSLKRGKRTMEGRVSEKEMGVTVTFKGCGAMLRG